jgi:hypothetical protein
VSAAARRLDHLRVRRTAREAERAEFDACRRHGLAARHATKLAWLAARNEERPTEQDVEVTGAHPEPEVA